MSGHRVLHDIAKAPFVIPDPGDAGTINIDRDRAVCALTSAGAETRTLAAAEKAGLMCVIYLEVDGGDVTLTVTNGDNETFDTAGDTLVLVSIDIAGTINWKNVSSDPLNQSAHISDPAAAASVTFTAHTWDGATDPTAAQGNQIVADLAALKTAVDANNTAIDSILVALETAGITASA